MSASPSGGPTPNGGPPRMMRRARGADPLVARKKKPLRAVLAAPAKKADEPMVPAFMRNIQPALPRLTPPVRTNRAPGWSTTPEPGTYQDFPLFTTKRAMMEGLRHHIARFTTNGDKDVDPRDAREFTRPVALHRRDPRQPMKGGDQDEVSMPTGIADSKELERLEILKAEKEARRAADLAQIAPTGKSASAIAAKKSQSFKHEKTSQVFRLDKTAAQKKESDLRYEEALPWTLEDADNKNIWVGNYEAALSDINVIFTVENNMFKMTPVEKWYKFSQKNQFKGFSIEEAEARYSKKDKESRWSMKTQEKQEADRAVQESRKAMGQLFTVKSESVTFKNSNKSEMLDADELDFDHEDLFQDDDEQATVEPDNDEEFKESKDRIKREQLGANIFDLAVEDEIDKAFQEELDEENKRKKLGKGMKKALTKREKMTIYESDSSNPYASSSEDDTSDDEKQAEIDKRKDEEAKLKAKLEAAAKVASGTNTPSGRPKTSDPLKKSKKRLGSPNLSESSGNESSRKKLKKKHATNTSRSSTPLADSRPGSRAPSVSATGSNSPRRSSIVKLSVNSSKLSEIQSAAPNPSPILGGSMSDGDATGGENSDGGPKKKIKLRLKSSSNSRASSPNAAATPPGGSRAGSPAPSARVPIIKPHELITATPPEGISIAGLLKKFNVMVGDGPGQMKQKDFIRIVKSTLVWDKANKILLRKQS